MIRCLWGYAVAVMLGLLLLIVIASADRGVSVALAELAPDPWFRVTLADAYLAFLTLWLWMAWKEPTWWRRLAWLVAVLLTGMLAIAAYLLLQISRLQPGDGVEQLLLRRTPDSHGDRHVPPH